MTLAQSSVTSDRRANARHGQRGAASQHAVSYESQSIAAKPADAEDRAQPPPRNDRIQPVIGLSLWRQLDRWVNEGGVDAGPGISQDENLPEEMAAMPSRDVSSANLEIVRRLERRRIDATGANDCAALAPLLDDELVYINSVGHIYDKDQYLTAIASHRLTYDKDFDVRESESRVLDGLVILVGVMLGHSRLDREQQVFHGRCLSVWREQAGEWRMVAWHSSPSYFGQF